MQDKRSLFNKRGEPPATIQFNESVGQIVVVRHEAMEFLCPSKAVAGAAWNEESDPETGHPGATSPGTSDA